MKRIALAAVLAIAAALTLPLAFAGGSTSSPNGCEAVNGHLLGLHYDADAGHSLGRLVGGIQGDYVYTDGGQVAANPDDTGILYVHGTSVTHTSVGDLSWSESSVFEPGDTSDLQAVVLAKISGGTGDWQDASGHLALWGYFHFPSSGELDYRGIICTGS